MTRYSLLYQRSTSLRLDDERMRRRIGALFVKMAHPYGDKDFGEKVLEEVGIKILSYDWEGSPYIDWGEFSFDIDLEDLLDIISLFKCNLRDSAELEKYISGIERIFRERDSSFRIDATAIVHPYVDAAFDSGRESAIRKLQEQKYTASIKHLNAADHAMLGENPNWREVVRLTFDSAENLFKQMYVGKTQLSTKTVKEALEPELSRIHEQDKTAMHFSRKQLESFISWIESAHFYRHEPGQVEPVMPPMDLAINFTAQGFAHIRWLADISSQRAIV